MLAEGTTLLQVGWPGFDFQQEMILSLLISAPGAGWGGGLPGCTPQSEILKITDFADKIISRVLYDLLFSLKKLSKSADGTEH